MHSSAIAPWDSLTTVYAVLCSQQHFKFKFYNKKIKGSLERSLLPSAIFLIFTRNRPRKSEDCLCTLLFIEISKERLKKKKNERTPPLLVSWRPWALAYSRDRPYNFACLSAVYRACLKVSGYKVIGRARGDLGAKFAANVQV